MIVNNRIDKAFGPIGAVAGITIFIVGLVLVFFSLYGLILVLFGAFVGFSSTSTMIDCEKKRVKFSNNLFGIISIGRWLSVEPGMKVGIQKTNRTWRTYSRGNRILDITDRNYRIVLFTSDDKPLMPLKRTETIDSGEKEVDNMNNLLGLPASK
jgi:hypothetical protein